MNEYIRQSDDLQRRLDQLQEKQDQFAQEISYLKQELVKLRRLESLRIFPEYEHVPEESSDEATPTESSLPNSRVIASSTVDSEVAEIMQRYVEHPGKSHRGPGLEKFIGENLVNKIGIAITILGVAIGVKYSIDHELISPVTRILLGYLAGALLFFLGIRLKRKFEKYSAVLVSGSLAIVYYITYAAYTYYALCPQLVAFLLMALITLLAVYIALSYDQQVIALIGLVGAYAVPFLLSNEEGEVLVLFGYIAIINGGILAISIRKYWKILYYASFAITWLTYLAWFNDRYRNDTDFDLALVFLSIYFCTFYFTFLIYNIQNKRSFALAEISMLMINSALFFGIGYSILKSDTNWEELLGLFTVFNALIHFVVGWVIEQRKMADKNLSYFITGLALTFLTIAIPVQLEGNWVTLLWAGEMVLLFWIGRHHQAPVYEMLSYPLMLLTFLSLMHCWAEGYYFFNMGELDLAKSPIFNSTFLTSFLVVVALGGIYYLHQKKQLPSAIPHKKELLNLIAVVLPLLLLFTIYFAVRNEIAFYWNQLHVDCVVKATGKWSNHFNNRLISNLEIFKTLWIINYSLLFFTLLSFLNLLKLRSRKLGELNLVMNLITILIFLAVGLHELSVVRENLVSPSDTDVWQPSLINRWIRYLSIGALSAIFYGSYRYIRSDLMVVKLTEAFDLILVASILWVSSSELMHWMAISGSAERNKLGLSILWGLFSLLLIVFGIWKKKKHLRIGAIALFGATLLKLFFYDLKDLDTVSKTILFVSLGILLLTISFIYNKYKNIITD